MIRTPAREEHLDSGALQQVAAREDRADLAEVPFPVQVLAVLQHLEYKNKQLHIAIIRKMLNKTY